MTSFRIAVAVLLVAMAGPLHAGSRASANYTIVADSTDGGGAQTSSANYANQGSLGGVSGLATSPIDTMKSGYVGELHQVTGLILSPTFTEDGTAQQLQAIQTLDDGTTLDLLGGTAGETWSVSAGQIPAGLTLDPTTGIVSGTPTNPGPYSFTVVVSDGMGDTAQQIFSGVNVLTADTPTMPVWALVLLAAILCALARNRPRPGVATRA